MRALSSIIFYLSISFVAAANTELENIRPIQLTHESKFLIYFHNSKLLEEGLEWVELGPNLKRRCNLSVKSYYDEELMQKTSKAVYTLDQKHGGSLLDYRNNSQRDQFTLWLTTENKNLPLLCFDCIMESAPSAELRHFTLTNIEKFIGQTDFFLEPKATADPPPTATELLPTVSVVRTLRDFSFSATHHGSNSTLDNYPRFKDGELVNGSAPCSAFYNSSATDFKTYSLVLPAGEILTADYIQESQGVVSLRLESTPPKNYSLDIKCFFRSPVHDFSSVKIHTSGSLEFGQP